MAHPERDPAGRGLVDESTRAVITWVLTTVTSVTILLGLGVKFVLVPYLKEHLVSPMREVQRQVTENHHSNVVPTLPDRIEDVAVDVRALTDALDKHLASSDRWLDKLTGRLALLEGHVAALAAGRHRGNAGP